MTSPQDYAEVRDWLYHEAGLLDRGSESEWLDTMVAHDVVYQVPARQTVLRAHGNGFAGAGFHLDERFGSLRARISRNLSPSAWTEDPPPRTRRFVTNIRVRDTGANGFAVNSNLLILRTRQDEGLPSIISAERQDALRRNDGGLWLIRRTVLLDLSVLHLPNLAYLF